MRRVLTTTLALVQSRFELVTLELREEKKRAVSLLLWGVALTFLAFMSLIAIVALVVFLLWENALAVLLGFSAFFVVLATSSFFLARGRLRKIPFGDTVEQLRKDRDSICGELF